MSEDEEEALLPDRVVRGPDGSVELRLVHRERRILRALVGDLHAILDEERPPPGVTEADEGSGEEADPVERRLYPDGRPDEAEASARFRDLVRSDIAEGRAARLAIVEDTLDADLIDDAGAEAWLGVLNDLRLVMATRLEVTEETEAQPIDDEDPDAAAKMVYAYVGWLEGQFVDVLAGALPEAPDDVLPPGVVPGDEPAGERGTDSGSGEDAPA